MASNNHDNVIYGFICTIKCHRGGYSYGIEGFYKRKGYKYFKRFTVFEE